jgi:hypothetical protein
MPSVGLEPTIPAFERAKTVHALDRAATVIGMTAKYRLLKEKPYEADQKHAILNDSVGCLNESTTMLKFILSRISIYNHATVKLKHIILYPLQSDVQERAVNTTSNYGKNYVVRS